MSKIRVEILDWRRSTDWSQESVGGDVGERSTDNSLEVFLMANKCLTDRSLEVSRWRGVILFQSVFDDGAAMRRSFVGLR